MRTNTRLFGELHSSLVQHCFAICVNSYFTLKIFMYTGDLFYNVPYMYSQTASSSASSTRAWIICPASSQHRSVCFYKHRFIFIGVFSYPPFFFYLKKQPCTHKSYILICFPFSQSDFLLLFPPAETQKSFPTHAVESLVCLQSSWSQLPQWQRGTTEPKKGNYSENKTKIIELSTFQPRFKHT